MTSEAHRRDTGTPATPLTVTRPELPPLSEVLPMLEQIWSSRALSNFGPLHQRFEQALGAYLGVDHVSLTVNATLALVNAVRGLDLTGEIITTPFSFVATSHAILWANCKPVFADVDPVTFSLDPAQIERCITPRTTGIMAVHCLGQACDVRGIQQVADRHGLKVIYDAAHAFGVRVGGRSVLEHGDASVLSFHATKVMNTFEGGAIVSRNAAAKLRFDHLANYGIVNEERIEDVGVNSKMNELSAAIGLAQLPHVDGYIERRRAVDAFYRERLARVPGLDLHPLAPGQTHNFSYFPVLVRPRHRLGRDKLYVALKERGIFCRRYFYPLLSDLATLRDVPGSQPFPTPVAARIASEVLCLPMYPSLQAVDIERVVASLIDLS